MKERKTVFFLCRYNRTKIRWSRNDIFLDKSRKFKVSKKGALRILDLAYPDTGIYACHAGLSVEKIKITVKKKPGDPDPTSEDYEEKQGKYSPPKRTKPTKSYYMIY